MRPVVGPVTIAIAAGIILFIWGSHTWFAARAEDRKIRKASYNRVIKAGLLDDAKRTEDDPPTQH